MEIEHAFVSYNANAYVPKITNEQNCPYNF